MTGNMYLALLQITVLSAATLALAAQPPAPPKQVRTLIRAGHLLDVHTGRELEGQTIIVTGIPAF